MKIRIMCVLCGKDIVKDVEKSYVINGILDLNQTCNECTHKMYAKKFGVEKSWGVANR